MPASNWPDRIEGGRVETLDMPVFTPERRRALEWRRQLSIPEMPPLEGSTVSLVAIVTRSSGGTNVWLNGRPKSENTQGSGVGIAVSPKQSDRAVVTLGDDPPASLKVGESINRATREKGDLLEDREVTARPMPRVSE